MVIYGPTYVSCSDYVSYQVGNISGGAYNWSIPGDWLNVQGQGSSILYAQIPSSGGSSGDVNVTVFDGCDYFYSSLSVNVSCGYYFSMSPNPASSTVTVSAKETTSKGVKSDKTITELNIYDQQGNLKKRQKFGKVKQATLNISDLRTGVYFVEIVDGIYKERQQLSVLR